DIPSFSTKVGDVVSVKGNRREIEHFKIVKEGVNRVIPKWLTTEAVELKTTVNALPQRDDVDLTLQESMIVEFYSR
ncbi:MAG: 30S ribosomal protein S4, partial [Eubacteriales bacterium]|nr:30S ribosomal protein S4 [Eubacteriales bacterium]